MAKQRPLLAACLLPLAFGCSAVAEGTELVDAATDCAEFMMGHADSPTGDLLKSAVAVCVQDEGYTCTIDSCSGDRSSVDLDDIIESVGAG